MVRRNNNKTWKYRPNIKRHERNASESQSNAEKVAEIIKYKLCLIVKAISLPIAYLSLLPSLIILQHTFLYNYVSLAIINEKKKFWRVEESHETFGINLLIFLRELTFTNGWIIHAKKKIEELPNVNNSEF